MTMNVMHKTQTPQTTLVASHRHARRHAFSSGRAMTCKRQAQRRQQVRANTGRGHNAVLAVAALDVGTKAVQAIKKSVGGDVFVAGVADVEEAQAGLDFAKRFEIIKGAEAKNIRLEAVDLSDESAIADALPRNARVLVAVGDNLGGQRADNQLLDRTLSSAVSKGAKQFILVTPLGGGGGGGLFGGLFGGGGGSSKKPSKIERQVAESGLDFVIVRTAKTEAGEPSLAEAGVSVTPQGSLTGSSKVTRSQVAEVVAEVLLQAQTDVLVEVAADPDTPSQNALPDCSIAEEAQDEDEEVAEQEEGQGLPPPAKGLFGRTQALKAQPQQSASDSSPQQNGAGLFGGRSKSSPDAPTGPQKQKKIGAKLVDAKPAFGDEDDDKSKSQKGGGLGGLFGGRSKASADAPAGPQKQKKTDSKSVDAKPAGKQRGGFGQLFGGKKQQEAEEEEEEDSAPQNPLAGLFGGAKKAKAEAQQATPSVEGARKSASKGVAAKVRQGKSATKQAASSNGAAPKKKGGFLQALGLGQESVYADDDK
ncbi:MAG: hypothetical protein FRX49_00215 [Trebouxia sp. A1-2]|nr:MAG: hypothetical protein FRX49_00215 [Trebouxia sp. A1-2]